MPYWYKAINDFTRSGGYYRLEQRIPFLDKPTLIMWGEKDDVLGIETAPRFQSAIAGSNLAVPSSRERTCPHLTRPTDCFTAPK